MTILNPQDWCHLAFPDWQGQAPDQSQIMQLLEDQVWPLDGEPSAALFADGWVGRQADQNSHRAASTIWNLARFAIAQPQLISPAWLIDQLTQRQRALETWLTAGTTQADDWSRSLRRRVRDHQALVYAQFSTALAALCLSTDVPVTDVGEHLAQAVWKFGMSWECGCDSVRALVDGTPPQIPRIADRLNPVPDRPEDWRLILLRQVISEFHGPKWSQKLGDQDRGGLRWQSALAMVERGVTWMLGIDHCGKGQQLIVPLVGHTGSLGHLVVSPLKMTEVDGALPAVFVPDPVRTGVMSFDPYWQRAFQAASDLARRRLATDFPGLSRVAYCFSVEFRFGNRVFGQQSGLTESDTRQFQRPYGLFGSSASLAAHCLIRAHDVSRSSDEPFDIPPDQVMTGLVRQPGPPDGREPTITHTIMKMATLHQLKIRRSPVIGPFPKNEEIGLQLLQELQSLEPVQVQDEDEAFEYLRQISTKNRNLLDDVKAFLGALVTLGLSNNMLVQPFGSGESHHRAELCIEPMVNTENDWRTSSLAQDDPDDDVRQRQAEMVDVILETGKKKPEPPKPPPPPMPLLPLLRNEPGLFILRGKPGAGKTVSLWLHVDRQAKALLDHLNQSPFDLESDRLHIPIVLPLREVAAGENRQLLDVAVDWMLGLVKPQFSPPSDHLEAVRAWLRRCIERNAIWLCLDARDELDSDAGLWLRDNLNGLIDRVPVLVTARDSEDVSLQNLVGKRNAELRLTSFDQKRRDQYIDTFFAGVLHGAEKAQELRAALRQSPGPQALGQIPLLLGLLCEVQATLRKGEKLPHTKTEVLKAGLYGILKSTSRKQSGARSRWNELSQLDEFRERLLRYMAWHFYDTAPQIITRAQFRVLFGNLPPDLREGLPGKPDFIFQSLSDTGILVPLAGGYAFVLRTFHEYCLAGWIACESPPIQDDDQDAFRRMIQGRADAWQRDDWKRIKSPGSDLPFKPLNQSGWWNVWPLVAGQLKLQPQFQYRVEWLVEAIREPEQEDLLLSRARLVASLCPEIDLTEAELDVIVTPLAALLRTETREDIRKMWGISVVPNDAHASPLQKHKVVWPGYGRLRMECSHALGNVTCRSAVEALGDSVGRNETEFNPIWYNRPIGYGKTEANALVRIGTEMAIQRLIKAIRSNKGEHSQLGCVWALEHCTSSAADEVLKEILFDTSQFSPDSPNAGFNIEPELAGAAIATLIVRGVMLNVDESWRALNCLLIDRFINRDLRLLADIVPRHVGRFVPVLDDIVELRQQIRLSSQGGFPDEHVSVSKILAQDRQQGLFRDLLREEKVGLDVRVTLLDFLRKAGWADSETLATAMSLLSNRSASTSLRFYSAGLLLRAGDQKMRSVAKQFLTAIVRDFKSATEFALDKSMQWLSRHGGQDVDKLLFSVFTDFERSPKVQRRAGRYLGTSNGATELLRGILIDPGQLPMFRKRAARLISEGSTGTTVLEAILVDPQSETWLKKLCIKRLASGGSAARRVVLDCFSNKEHRGSLRLRMWCTKFVGIEFSDEMPCLVPAEIGYLLDVAEDPAEHRKLRETCLSQIHSSLGAGHGDEQNYQQAISVRIRRLLRARRHKTSMKITCALILAALGDRKICRFLAKVLQSPKVSLPIRCRCVEYLSDSHRELLVKLLLSREEDLSIRLAIAGDFRRYVDSSEFEVVFAQVRRDLSTPENLRAQCVVVQRQPVMFADSSESIMKSLLERLPQTKWRDRLENTKLSEIPFVEMVCDDTLSVNVRLYVLLNLCQALNRGSRKNSTRIFDVFGDKTFPELTEDDCRRFQQLIVDSCSNPALRWGVAAVLDRLDVSPDSSGTAALRAAVSTCLTVDDLPDFVTYFLGQKLHEWSNTGWRFQPTTQSWDAP